MINYDDFAKLDIRIGTILSVEIVEGADKLLRLMVDVGLSSAGGTTQDVEDGEDAAPRQIISGIREFFEDPQSLVGRQCPFLINLEPRVIRGFESQGMILAASTETGFALLHPDREIDSGAKIK
ncbi:MAG: tRNA-binding protein [Candidatus Paceibacterota bacterium]